MPKRKNKKVPHAEQLPSGRYRCRVYDSETKKRLLVTKLSRPGLYRAAFCYALFSSMSLSSR